MGFDGLLRARHGVLSGILNGIDTDVWNPAADGALAATYDGDLARAAAPATGGAVEEAFGLEPATA